MIELCLVVDFVKCLRFYCVRYCDLRSRVPRTTCIVFFTVHCFRFSFETLPNEGHVPYFFHTSRYYTFLSTVSTNHG